MSDSPRIVFLVQTPFTWRDWRRNAIGWLHGLGYEVVVLDVTAVGMPENPVRASEPPEQFPGMTNSVIRDSAQWRRAQKTMDGAALVICLVGSGFITVHNLPILRAVARSGAPSLLLNINAHPFWQAATRPRSWRDVVNRLRRTNPLMFMLKRLPLRVLGVKPMDFVVYGGEKSVAARRLVTDRTQVIRAHAMDYDLFLEHQDSGVADKGRTAVFLDQYIGFHPDATAMGFEQAERAEHLYPLLRRFFDRIEADLNLEVIVAAHPRADRQNYDQLFGGRRISSDETCSLVSRSALVITSYSAAAGFAALYKKPTMLVATTRMLQHSHAGVCVRSLADALGLPITMLEGEELSLPEKRFNDAAFTQYVNAYIKSPSSPPLPLWHIIIDQLHRVGILPVGSTGVPKYPSMETP